MAADKEIMDPFVAAVANALSDASRPSYVELNEAFTRQHYEAIANIIKKYSKEYKGSEVAEVLENVADDLAELFKRDNPNFNKSRFLQACGV